MRYNSREMKPAIIAAVTLAFFSYFGPRSLAQHPGDRHENVVNSQLPFPGAQMHSKTTTQPAHGDAPLGNEAPEWSLAFIGLITALVIGWQSYETRRSANALMASERAWIEGQITEKPIAGVKRYVLSVTNKGKTPAQILRYEVWHGLTRDNAKVSKRILQTFSEDVYAFVGDGETRNLRDDFDMDDVFRTDEGHPADAEGLPEGAFWVTITYLVVMDGRKRKKRHTTSFLYLYDLTFSTLRRAPEYSEYN